MTDKNEKPKEKCGMFGEMFEWLKTGKVPAIDCDENDLRKWAKDGRKSDFSTFSTAADTAQGTDPA